MRPLTSPATATLALVLVLVLASALDVVFPAGGEPAVEVVGGRTAASGAWYCTVGRSAGEDELVTVAGTPPGMATSSALRIDTVTEGTVNRGPEVEVFPGGIQITPVAELEGDVAITGRWWRTPAAVARVWRHQVAGEASGVVEGPCQHEPSATWYLAGVSTAGGAQARIVVGNPFATDAAIAVTLFTDVGTETPELLKNIAVPARSVRTISLNDHAPERQDLGARIDVRAGRVVAEGWQSVDPAIGGVEGLALAEFTSEPTTQWTIPWVAGDAQSWLWVLNPGERAAALEVVIHAPSGGSPLVDAPDLSVAPGTVQRVELQDVLPEGVRHGAATVTSANGVPVVASGGTLVAAGDVERTGIAIQRGVSGADASWTIPSASAVGRSEALHIVNPTSGPAILDVAVAAATSVHAPDELQDLEVAPGTALDVDLRALLPDLDTHVVYVTASEGAVVVGIRTFSNAGRLDLVAHAGVPSAVWRGPEEAPQVTFQPDLAQRVGTGGGPGQAPGSSPTPTPTLEPAEPPS